MRFAYEPIYLLGLDQNNLLNFPSVARATSDNITFVFTKNDSGDNIQALVLFVNIGASENQSTSVYIQVDRIRASRVMCSSFVMLHNKDDKFSLCGEWWQEDCSDKLFDLYASPEQFDYERRSCGVFADVRPYEFSMTKTGFINRLTNLWDSSVKQFGQVELSILHLSQEFEDYLPCYEFDCDICPDGTTLDQFGYCSCPPGYYFDTFSNSTGET